MSEASIAAVQAAASALGISFVRPDVAQGLAQDAEVRISQIIQPIALLKRTTNSKRLTCEHINAVLPYFQQPKLLGYSEREKYDIEQRTTPDKTTFYFVKDTTVPLQSITQETTRENQRVSQFRFHWKMVSGTKFDEASLKTAYNGDKTSVVAPITSIFSNQYSQQNEFSIKSDNSKNPISEELLYYFTDATDLICSDNCLSQETVYPKLKTDIGTTPLLPYFLKFFFAQIADNLNNSLRMLAVAQSSLALVNNIFMPISIYVHPFLRIAFTLSQKTVISDAINNDTYIREISGEIIVSLIKRAGSEYPGIRTEIYNQLINTIFQPEFNYPILYGALYTLLNIDDDSFKSVIQHVKFIAEKCLDDSQVDEYADATYKMIKEVIKKYTSTHSTIEKKILEILKNFP